MLELLQIHFVFTTLYFLRSILLVHSIGVFRDRENLIQSLFSKGKYFGQERPPPPGGGRNKQISENEEEIKVFYC